MLEAINHLHDYGTGDTRPQLFECEESGVRSRWVLKLMDGSTSELAADWIGCLLARRVGVRCPDVAIANVQADALLTAPQHIRQWAQPGPALAVQEIAQARSGLMDIDMLTVASDDLGAMYALDAWLEVLDRRKPDGVWNAIKDMSVDDGVLCVLDFGKSLSPCFQFLLGGADQMIAPEYPLAVRRAASIEAALMTCDIMASIPREEIEAIVASVPPVWVTEDARRCAVRFLSERVANVRDLCLRMQEEEPS